MAFNRENATQQGLNVDPTTNDKHIDANDLEVQLGDAAGANEFRVLDSNNVAVVVADSDGYFSVRNNAEVHGGNLLVEGPDAADTNTAFITLQDSVDSASIFLLDADPDGSVTAKSAFIILAVSDWLF